MFLDITAKTTFQDRFQYRDSARRGSICGVLLLGLILLWSLPSGVHAQVPDGLEARLAVPSATVVPGEPIVIDFLLHNTTDAPMVLTPPGVQLDSSLGETSLSLSHIFSGVGFAGLTIDGDYGHSWTDVHGYQPPAKAASLHLPAHGIVGTSLAIDEFYPAVRRQGKYSMVWAPYGGAVTSNRITIEVAPRKQAIMFTDRGSMTIQFEYDLAPKHVENFIELARNGAYNQKRIHRIEPGFLFQTGCPNGDGTGRRADGKTLVAEFNDIPIDRGTVCMARLESDPNSASCQFFVTATRIPQWDGRYTVFGKLVGDESFKTLENIMSQSVGEGGRPKHAIILSMTRIVDVPPGLKPPETHPAPRQMDPVDSQ